MSSEVVYFLSEGQVNLPCAEPVFVKVGWSRHSPLSRRERCQIGNPRRLEIFRVFTGTARVEARLHILFSDWRAQGEWFGLPAELVNEIGRFNGERAQQLVEVLKDSELTSGVV